MLNGLLFWTIFPKTYGNNSVMLLFLVSSDIQGKNEVLESCDVIDWIVSKIYNPIKAIRRAEWRGG